MARPIDFSSLTRPERAVLVCSAALVVDGIVPWWFRVRTAQGAFSYNAGFTLPGIVAIAAAAAAGIAVIARAAIWPEPAPARDGALYTILGGVAAVSAAIEIARSRHTWIGPYVALLLALALASAGLRRRAQRKAGWT